MVAQYLVNIVYINKIIVIFVFIGYTHTHNIFSLSQQFHFILLYKRQMQLLAVTHELKLSLTFVPTTTINIQQTLY